MWGKPSWSAVAALAAFSSSCLSRCLRLFLCLALVAACLAAYLQVQDFEFNTCDDDMYVYDNPMVRGGYPGLGSGGPSPPFMPPIGTL